MSCDVCDGTPGRYPIHNRFGKQLYEIECPECFGSGLTDEEAELEAQKRDDARRYAAAMAETRGNERNHREAEQRKEAEHG